MSGVTFVLGKRCLDIKNISGTTSQYYVHKHKTLTTIDDYILDKVGFENSIWEDERKILFEIMDKLIVFGGISVGFKVLIYFFVTFILI